MSLIGSIIGGLSGLGQSAINYSAQMQNLNYQKDLQKQIFAREDNAVQRRSIDLQNAGLSKTLAAGDAAGAGAVVNTKAPQTSVVDDVLRGMSVAQMQADVKHVQAQTENLLKQNEQIDSSIETQSLDREYTRIKMAIEQGNLDMLPITKQQKTATLNKTNKEIEQLDEIILSAQLGRSIDTYKMKNILPKQAEQEALRIGLLMKEGGKLDADIAYRNLESDLLAYNLTSEMYLSKIRELDYLYQRDTGLKPGSGGSVGSISGSLFSSFINSSAGKYSKDLSNKLLSFLPWKNASSATGSGGRSW